MPDEDIPTDMIMTIGDWHHENSDEVRNTLFYKNDRFHENNLYRNILKNTFYNEFSYQNSLFYKFFLIKIKKLNMLKCEYF